MSRDHHRRQRKDAAAYGYAVPGLDTLASRRAEVEAAAARSRNRRRPTAHRATLQPGKEAR